MFNSLMRTAPLTAPQLIDLDTARCLGEVVLDQLETLDLVTRGHVVGGVRRQAAVVAAVDLVVVTTKPIELHEALLERLQPLLRDGNRFTGYAPGDLRFNVYATDPVHFGALTLWHTGSRSYLRRLEMKAHTLGLELRPDGLYRDGDFIAGSLEEDVVTELGERWLDPIDR